MADCEVKTRCVEIVKVEEVKTYVLTLSEEEARVLKSLCGKIGGDTKNTWRGKISNIFYALEKVGINHCKDDMKATVSGSRTGEQPGNFAIFAHGEMKKHETC